jgi:hypothetical protein
MRSDAVVEPSLGCEVEDAFERDDREHSAAVVEPVDLGVRACVGHGMLRECSIGMQTVTLRHREVSAVEPATPTSSARPDYQAGSLEVLPAARRLHGHDDDAFISPTTSIPGRASVRDRIDRAKRMTVSQAVRLKFYTTRSLKRDETAGYIRLVRATGEVDPDTFMRDAEAKDSKATEVQWTQTLT